MIIKDKCKKGREEVRIEAGCYLPSLFPDLLLRESPVVGERRNERRDEVMAWH
jgi:hypothetical protein